jgi:SAM-dependent methyltransferase
MDPVGEETLDLFGENSAYTGFLLSRLFEVSPRPLAGRVLEIGCGTGNVTSLLLESKEVTYLHAIDLDPLYVRRTLDAVRDPRLEVTVAPAEEFCPEELTRPDGQFDVVVSSNVLEHVADHERALANVGRMLRPDGVALILVPAHPRLFSGLDESLSHHRRYAPGDFRRLAPACGLRLLRCTHFNPLGALGWWLNGKVLRKDRLPAGQLGLYTKLAIPLSKVIDRLNPFPFGVSLLAVLAKD